MVQTLTRIGVKQDKVEYVVELLKGMIELTRQEEGCLNHNMYQDEVDSSILVIIEQWKNRDSFEDHLLSRHFDNVFSKVMKMKSIEVEMNIMHRIDN